MAPNDRQLNQPAAKRAVDARGSDAVGPPFNSPAFERGTRPLLDLVRELTGLETSFVSRIDWEAQTQTVVLASNTSDLHVPEGSVVEWSDSMCLDN